MRAFHDFACANFRSGIAEDNLAKSRGLMGTEEHPGHAAHGKAAEGHLGELKRIEEVQDVVTQLLDGIGAGSHRGLAVAARVVPKNAKVL